MNPSRRNFLLASATGAAGLATANSMAERWGLVPPDGDGIWGPGNTLNYAAHRLIGKDALAREFPKSAISKPPWANGTPPRDLDIPNWKLSIEGIVAQPSVLSVADIQKFPVRSQITHLACEEGWSYVAEWSGALLRDVLEHVGASPQARYVAYFSVQPNWWDSVDIDEARHPQTFVAHTMNGEALPLGHGAPLRMRVPRQLGYKSVKFMNRIVVTDNVKQFGKGKGSRAAERGYAWYNGI